MVVAPILIIAVIAAIVIVMRERADSTGAPRHAGWPLPGPSERPDRHVAFALARREARLLVLHPAVLAGIALSGLALAMSIEGNAVIVHREALWTGISAFPLAGMTLVAANLAVLRAQRFGAAETVGTTPAAVASRTAAHLVSVAGPAAVMAIMVAVDTINLVAFSDAPGRFPDLFELAHAPILVACAGVVGVLLATWVPTAFVAVPAVVALGMIEGALAGQSPQYERSRWLAWWVPQAGEVPQELWDRRPAVHALYLVGLGLLLAAAALGRSVRPRWAIALAIAPAIVVAVTAAALLAPISDARAEALASWVNDLEGPQECTTVQRVRICAYRGYDHRPDWVAVASGVLRALPGRPAGPLSVVQRLPRQAADHIDPRVTARFQPGAPRSGNDRWAPDGAVHPELRWQSGTLDAFLAVDLASAAVGLPVEQDEHGRACLAADQARAVAALWLAAHGSPRAREAITALGVTESAEASSEFAERVDAVYPAFGIESWVVFYDAPVRWSARDASYVRALLAADQRQVRSVLADRWADILRPGTSSDQLATWVGLALEPPLVEIGRAVGVDPVEVEAALANEPADGQVAIRGPCA